MASGRRSARRQAVFLLYQQDVLDLTLEAVLARVDEGKLDAYANRLMSGVADKKDVIDRILAEHVAGWSVDRLGALERAILRCGVYELLWSPDIPEAVAIDEAVGLGKRFCSAEAGALVNGVLGSVARAEDRPASEA